jgi:hypothetical protein
MNIFYLHEDPLKAAEDLCDQHVLKMGIESAQMLSTAHWMNASTAPYKKAHVNHPSTIWTRSSKSHYDWLIEHAKGIFKEYTKRYGKQHKTESVLNWLVENRPQLPNEGFVPPPQCMPEDYKNQDTVKAYRDFYLYDKVLTKGLNYNRSERVPEWLSN